MKDYKVSNTTLTSRWVVDERIGMSDYEHCQNCGLSLSPTYQSHGYECGEYCQRCGAKMGNPHYHVIEYDYD